MAYADSASPFDRLGRLLTDTGTSISQLYMATGLLERYLQSVRLTPLLVQQTLQRADAGYFGEAVDMYRRMQASDGHLRSVVGVRKTTGRRASLSLEPADDSDLAATTAEYAREVTSQLVGWEDLPYDLMEGVVMGFQALEIEWLDTMPVALWYTQPRDWRWQTGAGGGLMFRSASRWQQTPQDKFIICTPDPHLPVSMRGSMRACASPWAIKSVVRAVRSIYNELYGMPRVGITIPDSKFNDSAWIARLEDGIRTLGSQGYFILSEVVKQIQWGEGGKGGVAPHEETIQSENREMSKAMLGPASSTDSTGATGSLASIQIMDEVRSDTAESDLELVAATINRDLMEPMTRYAFGEGAPVPVVSFRLRDPDTEEREASRLQSAYNLGIPIPLSHARAALSIPEPGEGEEVLQLAPQTEGNTDEPEQE